MRMVQNRTLERKTENLFDNVYHRSHYVHGIQTLKVKLAENLHRSPLLKTTICNNDIAEQCQIQEQGSL